MPNPNESGANCPAKSASTTNIFRMNVRAANCNELFDERWSVSVNLLLGSHSHIEYPWYILEYTILYSTILYYTILYYTLLYYTLL